MFRRMRHESGQTLILVALALVLLIAFVALAIEIGHIYSVRRQMQNAADAGALAGARALCNDLGEAAAKAAAKAYAEPPHNLSQSTAVTITNNLVTVKASVPTEQLFFGGFAGIPDTMNIPAVAKAACGVTNGPCGIWPIAFAELRWKQIPCDGEFYVWDDDKYAWDPTTICASCDCSPLINQATGNLELIVGPADRGWVLLPTPAPYFATPTCPSGASNCGDQVKCWLENPGGYTGQISTTQKICLPGQPGVVAAVENPIDANVNKIRNILLYDPKASCPGGVVGRCSGNPYPIVGTGCIQVLGYLGGNDAITLPDLFHPSTYDCPKNVKVFKAKKLCSCESNCGGTTGEPAEEGEVRAASLVR